MKHLALAITAAVTSLLVGCESSLPPTRMIQTMVITTQISGGYASPPVYRTAPALNTCAALLQPGATLRWEAFQSGQQTNQGTFTVRSLQGNAVVLDQFAAGTSYQLLAVFQGAVEGSTLRMFNTHPNFPEHWTGECSPQGISGSLEGYTFRIHP